jgi:hypothetical protein
MDRKTAGTWKKKCIDYWVTLYELYNDLDISGLERKSS